MKTQDFLSKRRVGAFVALLVFHAATAYGQNPQGDRPELGPRVPFTSSRVIGTPDPPLPYEAARVLPNLAIDFPIFVAVQPGSPRLIFIDAKRSYGQTRLCRTVDDGASGEFEVLLDQNEVAYGFCFHPQFAENGYLYLGSNGGRDGEPKKSRITRYTIDREPPYLLAVDSAKVIIEWESNGHNGAAAAFGIDGMLYVTSGDGSSDSDKNVVGQGLDQLLAKVLRIDVDHHQPGTTYSIPNDNPFVDFPQARPETWAYGLRNPWRLTVDPITGHLWCGNNGQDLWEQVYRVARGANYGWSVYEGSHPFYQQRALGPTPVSQPTLEHPHSEARSITGGVVYQGDRHPQLKGAYLYGDYSTGKIWAAKVNSDGELLWHREIADTVLSITSFALDRDGEVLITDHRGDGKGGLYTLAVNSAADQSQQFPRLLSESGLFESVPEYEMAAGVIPYDVNSPLWSDGATKMRHLAIPETAAVAGEAPQIDYRDVGAWGFPNGTVLVKSFALDMERGNPKSRRRIETRLFTLLQNEWVGYSYAWNDEQTDATLVESGGADREFAIETTDGTVLRSWRFPSRTECMVCHSRAADYVLGLSTAQMNRLQSYDQLEANQLDALQHWGILSIDDEKLKTAHGRSLVDPYNASESLTDRVASYLHTNCSHCHVKEGGGNSQFTVAYPAEMKSMRLLDADPQHDRYGLLDAKLVAPGAPERSILLHRITQRGRGQMPPLASSLLDQRATELIRQWIESLKPADRP
jgi:uncharacterized repeat protein (TIGR03806 family)